MRTITASTNVLLFVSLNITDIALTAFALSLGASEMNYIYALAGNPLRMAGLKMLLSAGVISGLLLYRRFDMLDWINVGLIFVVLWNIVAIISWSI